MNVTNGFTSMEQIRHRMQTTDSQRQVKKQTVQTNTAFFVSFTAVITRLFFTFTINAKLSTMTKDSFIPFSFALQVASNSLSF